MNIINPFTKLFNSNNIFTSPKQNRLHHLIATQDPSALSSIKQASLAELQQTDPVYRLTPIAVAAMTGNAEAAELLLKRGVSPLPLDHRRWTPLHYLAVAPCPQISAAVKTAALRKKMKIPLTEEITRVLKARPAEENERVAEFETANGLRPITAKQFGKLANGCGYADEIIATPDSMALYWKEEPEIEDHPQMQPFWEENIQRHRQAPPELYFSREGKVHLKTPCKAYQVLGIHGGEIKDGLSDVINLPGLISDGFPNCLMESIVIQGVPYQVLVPLRDLKAGEQPTYDYGESHPVKKKYAPPSDEARAYYKQNKLKAIFKEICKINSPMARPEEILRRRGLISKLRYIFNSTYTMVSLLLDGSIALSDLLSLIETPGALLSLGIPDTHRKVIGDVLEAYKKIEEHPLPANLKKKVHAYLNFACKNFPLHELLLTFQYLGESISHVDDLASWRQLTAEIKSRVRILLVMKTWNEGEKTDSEMLHRLLSSSPEARNRVRLTVSTYLEDYGNESKLSDYRILDTIASLYQWPEDGNPQSLVSQIKDLTEAEYQTFLQRIQEDPDLADKDLSGILRPLEERLA